MTAALTRSSWVQFAAVQPARELSEWQWWRLNFRRQTVLYAHGPATVKLRGPKPAALVRSTTRSPWAWSNAVTAQHVSGIREL